MTVRENTLTQFKSALREILEPYQGDRDSTWISLAFDCFILVCILASCSLAPLEYYYPSHTDTIAKLELFFITLFVIEYLTRWFVSRDPWRYPFEFYALIDLIAILPSLLLLSSNTLVLRLVRVVRLLRLLNFVRYRYSFHFCFLALRTWFSTINHQYRLRQLGDLLVWALLTWIIGANLLYLTENFFAVENISDQKISPFAEYYKSYWSIIIVLISGIEDKEPLSLLGSIEVTLFMIVGIIIIGMLTGEIVSIIVKQMQRLGKVTIKPPHSVLKKHILILGENRHLENILHQLHDALKSYYYFLIVSPQAEELKVTNHPVYKRVLALSADPVHSHVLDEAHADDALRTIVLAEESETSLQAIDNKSLMITLAMACRKNGVPTVVELKARGSLNYAKELLGVDFVVSRHYVERLACQAVLNPGVTDVYYELMNFTDIDSEFYTVPLPAELIGKRFQDAQLFFLDYKKEDIVLIGIDRSPPDMPNTRFWINPAYSRSGLSEQDLILREGDSIIVIAYQRPSFAEIEQEDLWSGKIISRI